MRSPCSSQENYKYTNIQYPLAKCPITVDLQFNQLRMSSPTTSISRINLLSTITLRQKSIYLFSTMEDHDGIMYGDLYKIQLLLDGVRLREFLGRFIPFPIFGHHAATHGHQPTEVAPVFRNVNQCMLQHRLHSPI